MTSSLLFRPEHMMALPLEDNLSLRLFQELPEDLQPFPIQAGYSEFCHHISESVPVFGKVYHFSACTKNFNTAFSKLSAIFKGVCPPNCTITPSGFSFS
jgi:hypothetical protein